MTRNARTVRLVIADDHPIFRDGLKRLLEAEEGLTVVGEASDGEQAVQLTRRLMPDILLLDLAMPRLPGLEALRELSGGTVRTILLTAAIEKHQVVTALQTGARGIVLKDSATELLYESIRCVMDGQYWIGREAVADLVAVLREMAAADGPSRKGKFGLTPRERQITSAVVAGFTNREIAEKLSVSEDTVKHHVTHVFDKLGVSSRLELALFAINHGLVDQT